MCEGLGRRATSRAGIVWELAPPGGVRGEVTFACSHLVYSSGDKLVQAHKGVRCESGFVGVIPGSGVKGFPVVKEGVAGPPFEGAVCPQHELGRRDVGPRREGSVEDHGEA